MRNFEKSDIIVCRELKCLVRVDMLNVIVYFSSLSRLCNLLSENVLTPYGAKTISQYLYLAKRLTGALSKRPMMILLSLVCDIEIDQKYQTYLRPDAT
jgi:hypothetical protein